VELDDPEKLLEGGGHQVRHIRLASASDLDRPGISALMAQAVKGSDTPFDRNASRRIFIRLVSKKQRPRRPAPPKRPR
jgi:hypothetical protein